MEKSSRLTRLDWLLLCAITVLAGQAVDAAFITRTLRWMDSWVLTLE